MFEVGQKIVCVSTHKSGYVVKDNIYTILQIAKCERCGDLNLDVGVKTYYDHTVCSICLHEMPNGTNRWLRAARFRPLDDMYNEEVEELT
jgi:hypothetical protein